MEHVPLDVVRDTARRCERWRFTRGQEDVWRAGSKAMAPASRYKKKHPVDVKVHKSLDRNTEDTLVSEDAHEVQEMANVRTENFEYDDSSSSDDGLCRCPRLVGTSV